MTKFFKYLVLVICLGVVTNVAEAQKKKPAKRTATKRNTTARKTTKGRTNIKTKATVAVVDTVAAVVVAPAPKIDSLPVPIVKKSLRPDEAVETSALKDRTPLPYENLRADDALFRHKIWREIDAREKLNLPFRYSANENNGNQRFISILFSAIQDSTSG